MLGYPRVNPDLLNTPSSNMNNSSHQLAKNTRFFLALLGSEQEAGLVAYTLECFVAFTTSIPSCWRFIDVANEV